MPVGWNWTKYDCEWCFLQGLGWVLISYVVPFLQLIVPSPHEHSEIALQSCSSTPVSRTKSQRAPWSSDKTTSNALTIGQISYPILPRQASKCKTSLSWFLPSLPFTSPKRCVIKWIHRLFLLRTSIKLAVCARSQVLVVRRADYPKLMRGPQNPSFSAAVRQASSQI